MIGFDPTTTFPFVLPASTISDTIITLLFGWITFLGGVLPRVTLDRGSLVVAAVALVLFTFGAHFVGRKCYRRFVADRPDLPRKWPLRSTLAAVAGVFVLFTAGISLIGATHQVAWLAAADEPLTGKGTGNGIFWHRGAHIAVNRNIMKQIGLGLHNYHDVYGVFPAGGTFDEAGVAGHSWVSRTLNFLPYQNPIDFDYPWRHPRNEPHFRKVLPAVINASFRTTEYRDAEGFGLSHFAANGRLLGPNRWVKVDAITDGLENTIMIGEVNTGFRPWGDPVNWRDPAAGIGETPTTFGGPPGTDGATFLMADGSVRTLSDETDAAVLGALATPDAGDSTDRSPE